LAGILMRFLAIAGCVNPPTVKFVSFIKKLASPLTAKRKLNLAH